MADYTDDFAGTGAVSGNWTITRNTLTRAADDLAGGVNDYNNMLWSANTITPAQYSEMVISAANAFYVNISVRASGTYGGSTWCHYCFVVNPGGEARLERWVNNSQTSNDLGYAGGGRPIPANGDTVRLAIDANYVLTVYVNSVLQFTVTDATAPAALATGAPGTGCYGLVSRVASWAGGDVAGAAKAGFRSLLGVGR